MKRISGKKGAGAAVCFFSSSFDGGGVGMIAHCVFLPWYRISISLCLVIRVHSLVGEVDNGVCRVGEAVVGWLLPSTDFCAQTCAGPCPVMLLAGARLVVSLQLPVAFLRRISSWVGLLCGAEFPLHLPRRRWFRSKNSSWAKGDLALENDGHGVSVD